MKHKHIAWVQILVELLSVFEGIRVENYEVGGSSSMYPTFIPISDIEPVVMPTELVKYFNRQTLNVELVDAIQLFYLIF